MPFYVQAMKEQQILFEDVRFPFFTGVNCTEEIFSKIAALSYGKIVIVTDDTVLSLVGQQLATYLERASKVLLLSFPAGEHSKCFATVTNYLEKVLTWGADRSTLFVCLGGGIPGNVGGLCAALLFRGVRFVHFSTTLVGLFDSVLSLKQAVNASMAKNTVGTFHVPTAVFGDLALFHTLSQRDIRSGVCESIKNTLCLCPHLLSEMPAVLQKALAYDTEAFLALEESSILAKTQVMQHDKFEKHAALALEYGHTTGHAIELAHARVTKDSISHGEAVGIGMLVAADVARALGVLSEGCYDAHTQLLEAVSIRRSLPQGVTADTLIQYMLKDNKRGHISLKEDELGMVLLRDLGDVLGPKDKPIVSVPIQVVHTILKIYEQEEPYLCSSHPNPSSSMLPKASQLRITV